VKCKTHPSVDEMTDAEVVGKFYAYKHVPRGSSREYPMYALCYTPSSESWEVRAGEPPEFKCVKRQTFKFGKAELELVEVELADDVRREDKYTSWKWFSKSDLLFYFGRGEKFEYETRSLLGPVLESSLDA
jgi:hypothetical protein